MRIIAISSAVNFPGLGRIASGILIFPPFESAKCHCTWSGLYEQCELDGNPIIGATSIGNFYAVSGFSGHGMMHAPAAGRAVAELIVHGCFESLDLARLDYARVASGMPYREAGIL